MLDGEEAINVHKGHGHLILRCMVCMCCLRVGLSVAANGQCPHLNSVIVGAWTVVMGWDIGKGGKWENCLLAESKGNNLLLGRKGS